MSSNHPVTAPRTSSTPEAISSQTVAPIIGAPEVQKPAMKVPRVSEPKPIQS